MVKTNYLLRGALIAIAIAVVCSFVCSATENYESNLLLSLLDVKDGTERQALRDLHYKNQSQQYDQPHFDPSQPPIRLV